MRQPREGKLRSVLREAMLAIVVALLSAVPTNAQEKMILKVLGQPRAAGKIQEIKEQPFFERLPAATGLPIIVDYTPLGSSGFSDIDPLTAVTSGQVQLAALRISQVARREPSFLGLDLFGLNTDFKLGRRVIDAYTEVLDQRLQEKLGIKLMGPWPFGSEILFCRISITGLSDIKGRKVRVYDVDSAKFVESAGGIPVQLGFAATFQSLAAGAVDCAIGNPAAAVASGWPEAATHVLPIAFQLGINAYAMGRAAWNELAPDHRVKLMSAFGSLADEIWKYSEGVADDAIACSVGEVPCGSGKRFALTKLPMTDSDLTLVRAALGNSSLSRWAQACDEVNPGCSGLWKQVVGPLVGIR